MEAFRTKNLLNLQANEIQAIIMRLMSLIPTETETTNPETPQEQAQQEHINKE